MASSKAAQPLAGFGRKGKSPRATPAAKGTPDVDRDAQANCPTIAMNAGEFGRPKQPDHHVL
jgi:hypothetical protein